MGLAQWKRQAPLRRRTIDQDIPRGCSSVPVPIAKVPLADATKTRNRPIISIHLAHPHSVSVTSF